MSWLAEQQNRLYGDLRGSIDLSQERAEFADQLNNIKAELQAANKSHDFHKVDQLMQELLHRYEGTEGFDQLCEGLRGMTDTVHADQSLRDAYPEQLQQYRLKRNEYEAAGGDFKDPVTITKEDGTTRILYIPVPPRDPGPLSYDDKTIDAWTNLIGDKLDVVNKNDQLTMIHIQELKSTIDQGSQLASSFISSGDKTSSAIINNIA